MATQIVKVSTELIEYFASEMGLQNESLESRNIKIQEFKDKVEKSLNIGPATKEVNWIVLD